MTHRFTGESEGYVRVSEASLRTVTESIFMQMGVPEADARLATDVLVSSDLRGIESHGVSNMLRKYVRDYRNGKLNPTPAWRIIRETPSTASIDADAGLGLIIAPRAMEIAIRKAQEVGIGMVTMKNVGHMGMVSYYPMMALSHDMIGLGMTSSPPEVVPTGGAEPRLGTNPIALAAPANRQIPFVFDAATSVVSNNKLGIARRLGVKLPPGWIADAEGTPLMREADPPPEGRGRANMLPLGSAPELSSHKGYGLGCVVEILSGILAGGGFGAAERKTGYSHMVAAYRIDAFMDTGEFKNTMDEWLKVLKETKPAKGETRVLYPGILEQESEEENRKRGIPLHRETVKWFSDTCSELGIEASVEEI